MDRNLWPLTKQRYFAAVRPIEVSPIGRGFFSERGVAVLLSELLWIWLPLMLGAAAMRWWSDPRPPATPA